MPYGNRISYELFVVRGIWHCLYYYERGNYKAMIPSSSMATHLSTRRLIRAGPVFAYALLHCPLQE